MATCCFSCIPCFAYIVIMHIFQEYLFFKALFNDCYCLVEELKREVLKSRGFLWNDYDSTEAGIIRYYISENFQASAHSWKSTTLLRSCHQNLLIKSYRKDLYTFGWLLQVKFFTDSKKEIWFGNPLLFLLTVFGPPSYGGSYQITVVCPSVCLSVRQFGIFLRDGSLVFSDFLHDGR